MGHHYLIELQGTAADYVVPDIHRDYDAVANGTGGADQLTSKC